MFFYLILFCWKEIKQFHRCLKIELLFHHINTLTQTVLHNSHPFLSIVFFAPCRVGLAPEEALPGWLLGWLGIIVEPKVWHGMTHHGYQIVWCIMVILMLYECQWATSKTPLFIFSKRVAIWTSRKQNPGVREPTYKHQRKLFPRVGQNCRRVSSA